MAKSKTRIKSDEVLDVIAGALGTYRVDHPRSEVKIYRQNSMSVRLRIIDPDFQGTNRAERSQAVWKYLDLLPDEAVADISTVLLLTPEETKNSFANMEFDEPIPSKL